MIESRRMTSQVPTSKKIALTQHVSRGMTNYHIGLRGTTWEHIGKHRTTWERIEPLRTMPSAENCWYSLCVIEAQTRWARLLHAEHSIVSDMQRLSQNTHGKTTFLLAIMTKQQLITCMTYSAAT